MAGDAEALLQAMVATIQRYVVMSRDQAITVALWIVHTHVFEAADCTPYLALTSAAKRSGKTRLLELLALLVKRPWFTGRVTAAVLIRKTDKEHPTLLLDESDATFNGDQEYSEALRGLLNSGYRRGGKASLCVGQGAGMGYKDFSTFCPKVIAGIGKLPDTVGDRSIPITLKRRAKSEPVSRFRERVVRAAVEPIRRQLTAWAMAHVAALRGREPALPDTLGDRAQDVWEPLLAIADQVGGEWPALARTAALALSGSLDVEEEDIKVQLLADCRDIFAAGNNPEKLSTMAIVGALIAMEDRPWATFTKDGKPITPHRIARYLKGFGIEKPHKERNGQETYRGYTFESFRDAFSRYLEIKAEQVEQPNKTGPESPKINVEHNAVCSTLESEDHPDKHCSVPLVPLSKGGKGAERVSADADACCEGGPLQLRCKLCPQSAIYWQQEGRLH